MPLTSVQIINLTGAEARKAMMEGKLTCSHYIETLHNHIDRYNDQYNAILFRDKKKTKALAKEVDKNPGGFCDKSKPLYGIPVVIKNSISVADYPTTGATPALRNNVTSVNSPLVQSLVDAGAIILGCTNLAELSLAYTSSNEGFAGITRNAYNPDCISGGSSGGSGVAVALRFSPLAISEDTGGSVRCPAAMNGVYGLRPTTKRYNQEGIIPLSNRFDTPGPCARCVDDLIALDSVITGETELPDIDLKGMRIGLPKAFFWDGLDADVKLLMQRSVDRLRAMGANIIEEDILSHLNLGTGFDDEFTLITDDFTEDFNAYLNWARKNGSSIPSDLNASKVVNEMATPDMKSVALTCLTAASQSALDAAEKRRVQIRNDVEAYFNKHKLDAYFVPSMPTAPGLISNGSSIYLSIYGERLFLVPFIGETASVFPIGLSSNGLPLAGELVMLAGKDRELLALTKIFESILGHLAAPAVALVAAK